MKLNIKGKGKMKLNIGGKGKMKQLTRNKTFYYK